MLLQNVAVHLARISQPVRRNLPNGPPAAQRHPWHQENARHRPVRVSLHIAAATREKFYHTACAGAAYPAAPARHDPSSFESIAQIPASAPAPPAAPEIPRTGCARPPAAP